MLPWKVSVAGMPKSLVSPGAKAYEVAKSYVSGEVKAPSSRAELNEMTLPIAGAIRDYN